VAVTTTRQGTTFPPTGAGLVAFVDHAMERGLVKPALGADYKTTVLEVLPLALGPTWDSATITELDVDAVMRQFQVARGTRLRAPGLSRYVERLTNAIELFRPYANLPTAMLATVDNHDVPVVADEEAKHGPSSNGLSAHNSAPPPPPLELPPREVPVTAERLTYPFPLRDAVIVTLCLPVDLTKAEARRLAKFLDCLAAEEASPPGSRGRARQGVVSARSRGSSPSPTKRGSSRKPSVGIRRTSK
jgi:hypothetical protein